MSASALWFGPEQRPRFGWMHGPDHGRASAAVVLCPPLGLEEVCAHRTLRHLAERLAEAGLAVLRIDYDGTGNSAGGPGDPGRVEAWTESVRLAVDFVRQAGAGAVVVVGMRLGATVAAAAVAGRGVEGLVLWDPCASGRGYLREQQALGLFALGGERRDDGSVEVPGIVYEAETVAELGALAVAGVEGSLAGRVLVLLRPDRATNKAMRERLEEEAVEWGEATGQAELVDVEPFQVREPRAAAETVRRWVLELLRPGGAGAAGGVFAVPGGRTAVTLGGGAHGAVVERTVALGPLGLFGIVCEPEVARAGAPTVVLLNAGIIDHVGPSRLWVEFARRWAGGGARVVRFDLSGLGDSPARAGQREDEMYPPEAFDDLGEVVKAFAPEGGGEMILTGLCSGGYHSVEGGIAFGVGSVCLINPILTARPSEITSDEASRTPAIDARRRATTARRRWVRALPAHELLGSIVDRLPDVAWWAINKVAVASPPARIMERLVASGVDTYVVCGEKEAAVMRRGQAAAFRRLARTGRFHLEVMPGIDHELFARASRDRVGPVVTERILSSVSTAASTRPA